MYGKGSLVLVPFPFTDLSEQKKRPAIVIAPDMTGLVISPNIKNFSSSDLILMAVTSQVPKSYDHSVNVLLNNSDLMRGTIPKESLIQIDKVFTLQASLIIKQFSALNKAKIDEVLQKFCAFIML